MHPIDLLGGVYASLVERTGIDPALIEDVITGCAQQVGEQATSGTTRASAVLIMNETRAAELGLRPRARFRAFSVVGDDPLMMLTGPIPATHRILARSGLSVEEIDAFEVNEAFASVPLAWLREFGADPERVNPRGRSGTPSARQGPACS